jgi:hypothetical protein
VHKVRSEFFDQPPQLPQRDRVGEGRLIALSRITPGPGKNAPELSQPVYLHPRVILRGRQMRLPNGGHAHLMPALRQLSREQLCLSVSPPDERRIMIAHDQDFQSHLSVPFGLALNESIAV